MTAAVRTPRIVGYLFGLAFVYGVWQLEPRWITGALALIILYLALTSADRVAVLTSNADASLRGLIAPTAAGGGRRVNL